MSHSSGGVIHLDDSDANVEEVGSDVEEVVAWDHELRGTKTFSTGLLILSGRRFDSPNLDEQQKILFSFIDQPTHDYYYDDDYSKEEEEEEPHDQGSGGGIVVPIPVETRSQRRLESQQEHAIVASATHVRSRQGVENVVLYPGRIRLVIGGGGGTGS
jgi:hypothetical protein